MIMTKTFEPATDTAFSRCSRKCAALQFPPKGLKCKEFVWSCTERQGGHPEPPTDVHSNMFPACPMIYFGRIKTDKDLLLQRHEIRNGCGELRWALQVVMNRLGIA